MNAMGSLDYDSQHLFHLRKVWDTKPVLRAIYFSWYRAILPFLRSGSPVIELGSYIGNLKDFLPEVICTDCIPYPFCDACVDADRLPFSKSNPKNLVMVDVLHHLKDPLGLFREFSDVARPKDRLIILDPYVSILSYPFYKFIHHEPVNLRENVLTSGSGNPPDEIEVNECRSQLVFGTRLEEFRRAFPALEIVHKGYLSGLSYPLSGGFNYPSFLPFSLFKLLQKIEEKLAPAVMRLVAFKIMVVLERKDV